MSATLTKTQSQIEADHRHRSYDLKSPEDHIKLYDDWAETYDDTVFGSTTDYVGPRLTLEAVQKAGGKLDGEIFDAGCGTGLAGVELAKAGARSIDGIDISPGMLKVARKTGTYRELEPVDMMKPLNYPSDKYDVVTCVGTFTTGHVGPDPALSELVRVMKKGGVLAATIYHKLWSTQGFDKEVERLQKNGSVELISNEKVDYRRAEGEDGMAYMLVLRKN